VPGADLPKVNFSAADKIVHVAIYFILICIWQMFFYIKNSHTYNFKWAIGILIVSLFYGIIIEVLQELFTDSRSADVYDVVANLTGSIIGILFFKRIKHIL
jgi:VanZ family protein